MRKHQDNMLLFMLFDLNAKYNRVHRVAASCFDSWTRNKRVTKANLLRSSKNKLADDRTRDSRTAGLVAGLDLLLLKPFGCQKTNLRKTTVEGRAPLRWLILKREVVCSVQFNSHLFLSLIGVRTLKMPAACPLPASHCEILYPDPFSPTTPVRP